MAQWYSVENGSSGNVYDMKFKDQNTGWQVVENKEIYRTTNGGLDWKCIDMPYVDSLNFCSPLVISSDTLWISVNNGVYAGKSITLKSVNGGLNWSVINTNMNGQIFRYSFIRQNLIYGYLHKSNPDKYYLIKSTDTGINWSIVFDFSGYIVDDFSSYNFVNDSIGYISHGDYLYKTTNYGNNWYKIYQDSSHVTTRIWFINNNLGIRSKDLSYGTYKTTDGGYSWQFITDVEFNDIIFENSTTWFAVSDGPNRIYKTTDSGNNWNLIYQYTNILRLRNFSQIAKKGDAIFAEATFAGSIFKSTNNGLNWEDLSVFDRTGNFNTVSFANSNTGFIGGDYLALMKTSNGGENWSKFNLLGNPFQSNMNARIIRRIQFVNESNGYMLVFYEYHSDTLFFKTTNSGDNWNLIKTNINSCRNFYFISNNTGWAVNDTTIGERMYTNVFKSTDGGSHFNLKGIVTLSNTEITFFDSLYGYIACEDYLYRPNLWKTTDGGESWQGYDLGRVSSVHIIDRNIALATSYSQGIYKTTNAGNNWISVYNNPQTWEKIRFANSQTGFAITYDRNIYYTTNQGLNWNYSNIGSSGGLLDMYFCNQNTGFTVGNFGKIYKTNNTGGVVGINSITTEIPKSFCLHQNYPNPFNPVTKIKFSIPVLNGKEHQIVTLKIYDILGREISTLVNRKLNAGTFEILFDGSLISSGIYLCVLQSGIFKQTIRMVVLK